MQENQNQTEKINFQMSSYSTNGHSHPQTLLNIDQHKQPNIDPIYVITEESNGIKSEEDRSEGQSQVRLIEPESFNSMRTEEEQLMKIQRELEEIERQERQRFLKAKQNLYLDNQSLIGQGVEDSVGLASSNEKTQQVLQNPSEATLGQSMENQEQKVGNQAPNEQIYEEKSQNSPKEDTQVTNESECQPEPKEQIQESPINQEPYLAQQNAFNGPSSDKSQQISVSKPIIEEQKFQTSTLRQQKILSSNESVASNQLNDSKESINSKEMYQVSSIKKKIIEDLRQDLVLLITENLEQIFSLFKQKIPQYDQEDTIRALYVRFIGPEQTEKPQKNFFQPQNGQVKQNIGNPQSFKHSPNLPTNRFPQQMNINQQIRPQQNSISYRAIQKPQMLQTSSKRPYTKRGGQGNGNPRFFDQQKVAKLFIRKGYGLHVARQHLGPNIQNNHYTNLITTIIRETWRKMEEYVSRFRRVKPMDTNEFKIIKTSLVNCAKWMDSTDLQTFYGFMKVSYQMDNKLPYEDECIRLYNNCIRRWEEFKMQYETQTKIRTEKRVIERMRVGQAPMVRKPIISRPPNMNGDLRIPRNLPSDRELQDLTSLIKSQLRQTNPVAARQFIPQIQQLRSQQFPPPPQMMMRPPQQVNNFPRPMPPQMNGQRF